MSEEEIRKEFKKYYLDTLYIEEETQNEFKNCVKMAQYGVKSLGLSEQEVIETYNDLMGEIAFLEGEFSKYFETKVLQDTEDIEGPIEAYDFILKLFTDVKNIWELDENQTIVKLIQRSKSITKKPNVYEIWDNLFEIASKDNIEFS